MTCANSIAFSFLQTNQPRDNLAEKANVTRVRHRWRGKFFSGRPRQEQLTHPDHDDGQRPLGGLDDGVARRLLTRHLTVRHDHQDVVLEAQEIRPSATDTTADELTPLP